MARVLCERLFRELAVDSPGELIEIIKAEISAVNLTFAAEALALSPTTLAAPVLLKLLEHEHPLVREGAVLGSETHLSDALLLAKVRQLAENDLSPGVRLTAFEVVKGE